MRNILPVKRDIVATTCRNPRHRIPISKPLTGETPAPRLTAAEQKILARAKAKIEQIQKDMLHSKGLTRQETESAAKADLIAEDQCYFWTEAWQKDMRASQRDVLEGRLSPPAGTAEELRNQLDNLKRA